MSRDERLNRTQEVVGSIPISSTISFNQLTEVLAPNQKCECLVSRLVPTSRLTTLQRLTRVFSTRIQEVGGSI